MKIPLLVLAKPRTTCLGPKVSLPDGPWKIGSNHKDSTIIFTLNSQEINPIDKVFLGGVAQIAILKPGSESSISVYAIKCQ